MGDWLLLHHFFCLISSDPEIGPDFVVPLARGPEKKLTFLFFPEIGTFLFFPEIGPDFVVEPPIGPE